MKKILITGAGSYIGTSFAKYMQKYEGYEIDTVDMIDGSWRQKDFSLYDVVFHVAGIAHQKETKENAHLYYEVNKDLAIETAKKAKESGIKQFVLLSSMSVFGINKGIITQSTKPNPKSNYGKSKLLADIEIEKNADEAFKVAILRPPMVYGDGCKGNYQRLKKLALKTPVFPDISNKRSMIHIDKLCQYVKTYIDNSETGVFYPQDDTYVCTAEMVKKIADENGKKIHFTKIFNPLIKIMKIDTVDKVFGDLIYDFSEKQKKVLFVATVVKHHINAFHLPYFKMFKEKGWEIDVCARNDFGENEKCVIPYCDKYYDIEFERFPFKLSNLKAFIELRRLVNEEKYDIIHCHTPVGGALGRLAARKTRKKNGTKVIYTAHGFHFFKGAPLKNWLLYYPMEKLCSYFTDVLITINKEDYNLARKRMKAKQVEYVPGVGIDTEKFTLAAGDRSVIRKQINIPDNKILLVSVGELSTRKNHEIVIRALENISDVYYIIIGKGQKEEYLEKLVRELNLSERVKLLGYRENINEIYSACDVVVFPSLQEGLPVALMEAMACGLPVACSEIRGNTDLIDEQGGIFFNPASVSSCENAIKRIINMDLSSMGKYNAFKIKGFSKEIVHECMEKIYEDSVYKGER